MPTGPGRLDSGYETGRDLAEKELLKHLDHVMGDCCARLTDEHAQGFLAYPPSSDEAGRGRPQISIVGDICAYAQDCLTFHRARDSFGGTRRGIAFGRLGQASFVFDLSDVISQALSALRRNRTMETRGALFFLDDYFQARAETTIPDEIVAALQAVVARTPDRSCATGALSIQVDNGVISAFEALDRIGDWKDAPYGLAGGLPEEEE